MRLDQCGSLAIDTDCAVSATVLWQEETIGIEIQRHLNFIVCKTGNTKPNSKNYFFIPMLNVGHNNISDNMDPKSHSDKMSLNRIVSSSQKAGTVFVHGDDSWLGKFTHVTDELGGKWYETLFPASSCTPSFSCNYNGGTTCVANSKYFEKLSSSYQCVNNN